MDWPAQPNYWPDASTCVRAPTKEPIPRQQRADVCPLSMGRARVDVDMMTS